MVPQSQNCSFCENCVCRNLKTNKIKDIKVYISRKEISRGIYLNSQIFWLKIVYLRNRQKSYFLAKNFSNKGKKIFLDKNHQKFAKAILMHVSMECFLTFLINFFHFLKILAFLAQKTEIMAKK